MAAEVEVAAAGHGGGTYVYVPMFVPAAPNLPGAQTANLAAIKTVAVISAIGQTVKVEHIGFWGTTTNVVDVTDWKLDDLTTALVKRLLGARFAFKDVAHDRAALAAIPNGPMDNSTTALAAYLASLPRDGLDAFLVIRPDVEYGAPCEIGLALMSGSGIPPTECADYEIDVVDAHSLTILAKAYSRMQPAGGGDPTFSDYTVGEDLTPADDAILTDAQRAKLRFDFTRIMVELVLETLRALALADLPAHSLADAPAASNAAPASGLPPPPRPVPAPAPVQ